MKTGKRRLAAFTVVAATMLLALVGVVTPAWAEGESTDPQLPVNGDEVTITSTLTMDKNAVVPNAEFHYAIEPAVSSECASTSGMPVTPGVSDAVKLLSGNFSFSDSDLKSQENPNGTKTITANLSVGLITSNFRAPGIYRYKITQQKQVLDGLTVTHEALFLDVYVENNGTGFVVKGCTLSAEADSGKKTDGFVNDYATHMLTIKKIVAGNQGEKNKDFDFTFTIKGIDGESYGYATVKNEATTMSQTPAKSGTAVTVSLKHGESVIVYGLSPNDTYAINEADYSSAGYKTSYKIGESGTEVEGKVIEATSIGASNALVAFTNTKDVTVPTDVIRTVVPYAAIVAFAAVMGVVFFRPRRNRR